MALIETKITATSHKDYVDSLVALAQSFGAELTSENVSRPMLDELDPNILLEMTKERFRAMGFDINVVPLPGTVAEAQTEEPKQEPAKPEPKATRKGKSQKTTPAPEPEKAPEPPEASTEQAPAAEAPAETAAEEQEAETAEETVEWGLSEDELKELKAATMKRIGVHWSKEGSRKGMVAIRDAINERFKTTHETFSAMPATMFPDIAKELDAYEQPGDA